jgi:hypothetical protein
MAKQLNIFLENKPGRLAAVTDLLFKNDINIRAITIQDRGEFGMMKILVDKPEKASLLFSEKGFACALMDVLAVRIEDRPGGLNKLAAVFAKHGINVVDGYGFVLEPGKWAVWCVQVESLQGIQEIVRKEGFDIVEADELYSI